MTITFFNKPLAKTLLILSLFIIIFYGLTLLLKSIIVPLGISFIVYTILRPYSNYLLRNGLPKTAAILLPLLMLITVIVLGITFIVPEITDQVLRLQNQFPEISQAFNKIANQLENKISQITGFQFTSSTPYLPDTSQLQKFAKPIAVSISQNLLGASIILFLVPIFSYFLLRDFKQVRNLIIGLLPNKYFELGWSIYFRITTQLQIYLSGIMLQSLIMFVVTSFGFFIVGIESALLLGFLAGLLNIIPYIGPLLAMAGPVLVALAQYPNELQMILVAVSVILAAQLIDNLFVIPSLIANSVNLHPMTVICGVIIFGSTFDLMGMVIAIPALATVKILFLELNRGLKSQNT